MYDTVPSCLNPACELNPMMTRLETKEECNGAKRKLLHLEEDSEKYK